MKGMRLRESLFPEIVDLDNGYLAVVQENKDPDIGRAVSRLLGSEQVSVAHLVEALVKQFAYNPVVAVPQDQHAVVRSFLQANVYRVQNGVVYRVTPSVARQSTSSGRA